MKAFEDYGKEKADVENLLKNSNLENYKILRPTYIVGVENPKLRLGYYISSLQNNSIIHVEGDGNNLISLVFGEDVVECILKFIFSEDINSHSPIPYNICNDECLTVNSFIKIIAKELGIEEYRIQLNSSKSSHPAIFPYTHYGVFSNKNMKNYYNQNFKSLKESLPEYIEWFKLNS